MKGRDNLENLKADGRTLTWILVNWNGTACTGCTRPGRVSGSFEQGITLRVQSNAETGKTESNFMGNH